MLSWYEIPYRNVVRAFDIEQHQLEYDDNLLMALVGITEKTIKFFNVVEREQKTRTYGFHNRFLMTYSMSLDLFHH